MTQGGRDDGMVKGILSAGVGTENALPLQHHRCLGFCGHLFICGNYYRRLSEVIRQAFGGRVPRVTLHAAGGQGTQGTISWIVNGALAGQADAGRGWVMEFPRPGEYAITAFDESGRYDRVTVEVR